MKKMNIGNIEVKGDVTADIKQTVNVNFKWLGIAIIVLSVIIFSVFLCKYLANRSKPDYFVTRASGVVHNRICTHYGRSQGFYLDLPGGYRNCKICGGSTMQKRRGRKNETGGTR